MNPDVQNWIFLTFKHTSRKRLKARAVEHDYGDGKGGETAAFVYEET